MSIYSGWGYKTLWKESDDKDTEVSYLGDPN